MLEGGVRYNADRRAFDNCSIRGDGPLRAVLEHLPGRRAAADRTWRLLRPRPRQRVCARRQRAQHPEPGQRFLEDRLNWTPRAGLLIYANVSKGYKAGAAPGPRRIHGRAVSAGTAGIVCSPTRPASRPACSIAAPSSTRRRSTTTTRTSSCAARCSTRSSARSRPWCRFRNRTSSAVEAQLIARPIEGLTIDTSATYVETEIDRFTGFDARANFGDHSGTPFPFSPKWQSITNVDYAFPLSPGMKGFVGASLTTTARPTPGVGALDILRIDGLSLAGFACRRRTRQRALSRLDLGEERHQRVLLEQRVRERQRDLPISWASRRRTASVFRRGSDSTSPAASGGASAPRSRQTESNDVYCKQF